MAISHDGDRLDRLAHALLKQFGRNAVAVVDKQVSLARAEPSVAEVWEQVATRVREWVDND